MEDDHDDFQEEEAADSFVQRFWQEIISAKRIQPNANNVFPFPNPAHTNSLDPEAFLYYGSQLTFIAWDLQFGSLLMTAYGKAMPPCPNCKKADCVQAKSWASPRRVFDHNKVIFLSSRRFRCNRPGCPSFTGTDPRLLQLMHQQHPILLAPLQQLMSGYLLTHKAGVTTSVARMMRNDVVTTGNFSNTARNIQLLHLEQHNSNHDAYLRAQLLARRPQDVRSHLAGLPALPPPWVIPRSLSPPLGPYYTNIYLEHNSFVQEREDFEALMQSLAGYFFKVDFCFKPCKRVRVSVGERAYEATFVAVNEYMQVPVWYACESTSFEDMQDALRLAFTRIMQLNPPDDDGKKGVLVVYVDDYRSSAALLRRLKLPTDRPGGVLIRQDSFHFISNITDTCNKHHTMFSKFQQDLSRCVLPLHPPDVLAVQAANPGLPPDELCALVNEQCRKAIPPGQEHWPKLAALMAKWVKTPTDPDGRELFGAETMPTFELQQDIVLEDALTDPLPVEKMYYIDTSGEKRAKRGSSDVENTNLHLNGVLRAPGHSCELAHQLFTDSLGRRNVRMAISCGAFRAVQGDYSLRQMLERQRMTESLGMAPLLDPDSAQFLQFLEWPAGKLLPEKFGFNADFAITHPTQPLCRASSHPADLPA